MLQYTFKKHYIIFSFYVCHTYNMEMHSGKHISFFCKHNSIYNLNIIVNNLIPDIITKIVEDGGTRWLIYLLTTDNLQLQNEGVIGLTITASLKLGKTLLE